MKKAYVLMQAKDAGRGVARLRSLGVVHIEHQKPPQGKDIASLREELTLLETALDVLLSQKATHRLLRLSRALSQKAFQPGAAASSSDFKDPLILARHIHDCAKRLDQLEEYGRNILHQFEQWRGWGDFDPEAVEALKKENIDVGFYQVSRREMKLFPPEVIVKKIKAEGETVSCVAISRGEVAVPFKALTLPKAGPKVLTERLEENGRAVELLRQDIRRAAEFRDNLFRRRDAVKKDIEFQEVLCGRGEEGELVYLAGYLPCDQAERLTTLARGEKWAVLLSDPGDEDRVPVLIRNPRWVAIIRPIFKFLEILPGYRELDISLPFLIFFSIFFGILIGDAGYGLVYFLAAFFCHRRARQKGQETSIFALFYILSLCAVVWGVLTGTFFGHEWVAKAGYKGLAPMLVDEKGLQRFCFLLGVLHLSLAHAWRALLKAPALAALADVGWMGILWAAYFLARVLILGDAFPLFGKPLIVAGATLVIFFTNPQRNIFKSVGAGLGALALSAMNNFTDVVSYVRLFAVGLAGVAIADAFNAMAAMVGRESILAFIGAALIALIGHSLGIVLGPVSVLVHGVRLNVLEFSGHANISWSGTEYKPFKEE